MHGLLAALVVGMTTFDESLHPRGQASNAGQFIAKSNAAPTTELVPVAVTLANTRYTLLVDGRPHTSREPGADGLTVHDSLEGMPTVAGRGLSMLAAGAPESDGSNWVIRAEAIGRNGVVEAWEEVLVPAQGRLLVLEHQGDYMTLSDLDERGITLFDVEAHDEEIIAPNAAYPDEPIDLDEIRKALTVSPGDGPSQVELVFSPDKPFEALIDVHTYEDFLWRGDEFTGEELDEHRAIVEEVYREWFGAEIDVYDTWRTARVTITTEVDRHRATNLLILESAHSAYATFRNQTDPGTYGSRYVGTEIRRRIDAVVAQREAGVAQLV